MAGVEVRVEGGKVKMMEGALENVVTLHHHCDLERQCENH